MIRSSACCWPLLVLAAVASAADWKPAAGPLTTKWGKDVAPEKVHPEYPRPQMVREKWTNLNGLWQYAVAPKEAERPEKFGGSILVPFCIESSLSGVGKRVGPQEKLWYRRTFAMPALAAGDHYLIHFGAVDWETIVFINGKKVGEHRGGYDPFSFDITAALDPKQPEQELVVAVSDPTDAGTQPRGKQIGRPHGIWYTPITGIWQTVWLETVPAKYIRRLVITPKIETGEFTIKAEVPEAQGLTLHVAAKIGKGDSGSASGAASDAVSVKIAEPHWWSPSDPFLYDLAIELREGEKVVDRVTSYAGLRKISLERNPESGVMQIMLNGRFLFQYGPLDQGFWPDGLYTAPSDEALKYDIEVTKRLGFNMIRKHVKVEPARWYYHCDRLGILVWQDMPSGDRYIGAADPDIKRSGESARQFETEWRSIISSLINHPSIVMWVPFNEGWGQFDTARITDFTRQLDPNRLVNSVSGWADRNVGDVHDWHVYPGPGIPPKSETRARVLGEFGGLGLPLEGHTWQGKDNWGYRSYEDRKSLQVAYLELVQRLRLLIGEGLSAAVYTQTTDVEIEVNGLMTYDRAVLKLEEPALIEAHRKLYLPPPTVRTILPNAKTAKVKWHHTYDPPAKGWEKPTSDAHAWPEGLAGFGTEGTPGARIGSKWATPDCFLWRKFDLPEADAAALMLEVHHDENCEIYLNGELAAKLTGYTSDYELVPISAKALATLKKGENVIAVHCHQTIGGQYIDVGMVELKEKEAKPLGLQGTNPGEQEKLVVDLTEQADPVLRGRKFSYDFTVENRGVEAEKHVTLVVLLPVGVTFSKFFTPRADITIQRVSADHRAFDLTPIEELRSGEKYSFRVEVAAVSAGKFTTQIQARSESHRAPIFAKKETTILEK